MKPTPNWTPKAAVLLRKLVPAFDVDDSVIRDDAIAVARELVG